MPRCARAIAWCSFHRWRAVDAQTFASVPMSFRISATAIDGVALQRALADQKAGACVTFEGWVRNRNEGQPVLSLEYEAYLALAEKEGEKILEEARRKFSLVSAA